MAKSHLALFLVGTAANSGKGAAPLGVELVANSHTDSQGSSSAFLSLVELEKLLVGNVVVTISAIMAVAIVLLLARRQINWRWGAAIIGCFRFGRHGHNTDWHWNSRGHGELAMIELIRKWVCWVPRLLPRLGNVGHHGILRQTGVITQALFVCATFLAMPPELISLNAAWLILLRIQCFFGLASRAAKPVSILDLNL